jgi:hypothetical protein
MVGCAIGSRGEVPGKGSLWLDDDDDDDDRYRSVDNDWLRAGRPVFDYRQE